MLAEYPLDPEQRQEFLAVVQHQVQRLEHLLQDLMAIRDLETGALETRVGQFHLPDLVEEVVAGFRPYPVIYHFDSEIPPIYGDRWQVSQVIVNLISNAVKYSPDGSPVEIGASFKTQDYVKVWVQDHGLGIPAADQPYLFERFYRVKHADRQNIEGTGLGLSSVNCWLKTRVESFGLSPNTAKEAVLLHATDQAIHKVISGRW